MQTTQYKHGDAALLLLLYVVVTFDQKATVSVQGGDYFGNDKCFA